MSYLGAAALLLFLLPALLEQQQAATLPEDPAAEERFAPPPPPVPGENFTLQLYVAEEGRLLEVELEVYVAGVVAAEMPLSFHGEALKAQAVAARTYALQKGLSFGGRGCGSRPGADLCTDSSCCQAFDREAARARGAGAAAAAAGAAAAGAGPYQKIAAAVEATRGLVLVYGGELAQTVYHSTCGGRTAAAAEVWGQDFPYLQPVPDPYCRHSPYFRGETRMSLSAFQKAAGVPSGGDLRRLLGLPSSRFHWVVEGDEIVFFTQGYGHGAGLCQYGADGMGREGKSFAEILGHYYKGCALIHAGDKGGAGPEDGAAAVVAAQGQVEVNRQSLAPGPLP